MDESHSSLTCFSPKFYQSINEWQIRILILEPGHGDAELHGCLEVADVIHADGVVLHRHQVKLQYSALSYCWGALQFSHHITCNGQARPITRNLHDALQRVRDPQVLVYIWVDALCINQYDEDERSMQVGQMLTIFSKAAKVIVWLGDLPQLGEVDLSALTKELEHHRHHEDTILEHAELIETLLQKVQTLLEAPWFHRIWVLQEIWSASAIEVIFNLTSVPWERLEECVNVASRLRSRMTSSTNRRPKQIRNIFRITLDRFQRPKFLARAQIIASGRQSVPTDIEELRIYSPHDIVDVLRRSARCLCSDLRDHIYGLLGMSTDARASVLATRGLSTKAKNRVIIIDYCVHNTAAAVFEQLARYIMRRDDSLRMLLWEAKFGGRIDADDDLPSWVPDWRHRTDTTLWLAYVKSERGYHLTGGGGRPHGYLSEPRSLGIRGWALGVVGPELQRTTDELSAVLLQLPSDLEARFELIAKPDTLQTTDLLNNINSVLAETDPARILRAQETAKPLEISIRFFDKLHHIQLELDQLELGKCRRVPAYSWDQVAVSDRSGTYPGVLKSILDPEVSEIAYAKLAPCPDFQEQRAFLAGLLGRLNKEHPEYSKRLANVLAKDYWLQDLDWAVPAHARVGDVVVATLSSALPLVLRPQQGGTMRFVGPCALADISPRIKGVPLRHWWSDNEWTFSMHFNSLQTLLQLGQKLRIYEVLYQKFVIT